MIVNKEKGQALLVVVLVMVVALTVGLSLTSRSIVNVRTSTEEADSQKALAAAEAGIEQALQIYSTATIPLTRFNENNTTYSTEIKEVAGADPILTNGGNLVLQDDGIDVWLVPHNPDGTADYGTTWSGDLDIYWGDPLLINDCDNAAIEVAVISGSKASPVLKRYVFDPCDPRTDTNSFDKVTGGDKGLFPIEGKKFKYKEELKGGKRISSGLVARVVPIYASTAIAVDGSIALPIQGFAIDSDGTSGLVGDERQVKRSLSFFRTYDQVPTQYFMYGLFSP